MVKKKWKIVGMTLASILAGTMIYMERNLYKTMSPDLIRPVKPIKISIDKQLKEPIDYGKLTEQEAIQYVQTPKQTHEYLNNYFKYDHDENSFPHFFIPGLRGFGRKGETFKNNHKKGKGGCYDYSTMSAALLSDNGYPPLKLMMRGIEGTQDHEIFLYKTEKGFGGIGTEKIYDRSRYKTINKLIESYNERYKHKNYKWDLNKYFIINLDQNIKNKEWIDGDLDLLKNTPIHKLYLPNYISNFL